MAKTYFWQNWCKTKGMPAVFALLCALLGVRDLRAAESPTAEMLKPVQALGAFMAALPANQHADMFAGSGVTVVENYAPFIFSGTDAVDLWEAGFRQHTAHDQLTELAVNFGPAQDFSAVGRRAYFCLPTVWTGRTAGKTFEEHGAWSFVLVRAGTAWKILGYGWGVTSYSESR
jgi:hypothetical protein